MDGGAGDGSEGLNGWSVAVSATASCENSWLTESGGQITKGFISSERTIGEIGPPLLRCLAVAGTATLQDA